MGNTCRNCEYWAEKENSEGYCEMKPQVQKHNSEDDVLNIGSYETTDANYTCEDFEPRYVEAE